MVKLYFFVVGLLTSGILVAQSSAYRSIDGFGNNTVHPEWGASGDLLLNRCAAAFGDGRSTMSGADRPNPRLVSNYVVRQDGDTPSEQQLNDLWWAFGQFVDHDIALTHDSDHEFIGIVVPRGDADFDPDSTGQVMLPMMRSAGIMLADSIRRYANEITAFIDGSNIYGSDRERAAYLRSFNDGKLRTTVDRLPIFNTLNGEYAAPVDPSAPAMAGQRGPNHRLLVCGDARANENSLLASLHTVWVREHNRLCDSLLRSNPLATDEDLYQHARALVAGMLQHIIFEEWLPPLGVELSPYSGYQADVHAGIGNEFAAAAFRFGHSLVGSELELRDANGGLTTRSPLTLRTVFFDPIAVLQQEGVDALLRGAAAHPQQALDCQVVDDLRSFLFGQPGAGGLDLAALNINRGRDRGLGSFNALRSDLGFPAYTSFAELTHDGELASRLSSAYLDIDQLDAWVGLLAEAKRDGVGETLRALLVDQFERLRDGDRFYYLNDPALTASEQNWIARQTLAAVLTRNTDAAVQAPTFRVAIPSSTAYAKTDEASWTAARVADQLVLRGLAKSEIDNVTLTDALGRELATWKVSGLSGFGESPHATGVIHLSLGTGIPSAQYVVSCYTAGAVSSRLVQL